MSPSSCKPEATNPASARPACQKPEGQLVLPARWRSGRLRGHLNRRANIPRSELRQNSFSKTVPSRQRHFEPRWRTKYEITEVCARKNGCQPRAAGPPITRSCCLNPSPSADSREDQRVALGTRKILPCVLLTCERHSGTIDTRD